ncbi:gamma-aminobutyric acid type B receptor subunit 1-like [Amphiura filiformis]|uniref:gamma-aminobutyric acid type B receptor subunit 1-like n=1 Tax=Amphiura filiformis TaxID=82378 RepID=UPI003B227384
MERDKMISIVASVFLVTVWLTSNGEASNTSEPVGETKIPLYIGGLLPFSGGWDGSGLVPGIDLALEQINNRDDMLPGYDLRIVWNDTQCSPGLSSRVFFDQIYREPQKIMILGGGCSSGSEAIAGTSHYWNLISVSPTASSPALSNRVKYPLFYRTYPTEKSLNPARIAIMKEFGWTRVATIHENYELFSLTVDDLVSRLKEANITLISSESFVDNPKNQIENLKKQDAKIIVAMMYADQAQKIFCEAIKLNMTGDGYVWMLVGWYLNKWWEIDFGQLDCTTEELTNAVGNSYYFGLRSQGLSSSDDITIGNMTAGQFDTYIKDQLANNPKYSHLTFTKEHPFGYDTVWAIALALNESINVLKATAFPDGRIRRLEDFNYDDSEMMMVFYESLATVSFSGVTICMCGLAGAGILLAMGFLVFNIKLRKQRYVKLSSPNLNNLIIVGGMIVYTAVFFGGVDTKFVSASFKTICCQLNVWVLSIGFVLSYGSMFSKTWRVYQVAAFKTPKRKVITDHLLYTMVFLLLLFDVGILTAWQVVDPMKLVVKELYKREDPTTPNQLVSPYIELCKSDYILYWLLALYIYKGFLLIFGAFLAWETRKVTIDALNDSKFIGISVYNVIILCTIGVTVSFLIGDDPEALYLFISGIIIFCNTVTLFVIFIPKIISVWKCPEGEIISTTNTTKRPPTSTTESMSFSNLSEENGMLKATISELTQELEDRRQASCCELGCFGVRMACFTSDKDRIDNSKGQIGTANTNI